MDRAEKSEFVSEMRDVFRSSAIVLVTHYKGLTVAEVSGLRVKLREAGARFKVTKNTLTKLAIANTPYEKLADTLTGPTAIVWSDDPVAVAKVTTDYVKTNPKLQVIAGGVGQSVIDVEGLKALAKMPPIEELRAKLLGVFKAPLANTLGVLQAPAQKLVGVINAPGQKFVGVLRAKAQQGDAG